MTHTTIIESDEGGLIRWVDGDNGNNVLLGRNRYHDSIDGNGGNDIIDGAGRGDELYGGDGNDRLYGSDGGDIVDGGRGNDRLDAGYGDDEISGGDGRDTVYAGAGDDSARLGRDDDRAGMREGNDFVEGGRGRDQIWGDEGDDVLLGDEDDDRILGGAGNDQVLGGDGNDSLYGGSGDDHIEGGSGDDLIGTDNGDTLQFAIFAGEAIGQDTVQGTPGEMLFRAEGTLEGDGRDGEIDMVSFLDSNGSGQITGADLWVRTDGDDLVLDIGAIYGEAFEEDVGPQTITFQGLDRLDDSVVPSVFQPNVEFGRPVGVWDGGGIDIHEPGF